VVVVQLKGVPKVFDSIEEKYDFLLGFYADLLDLAEELQVTDIDFYTDKVLH